MIEKSNFLTGLKVVDCSTVLAGPSVATYFAELGASVIKIESPAGDVTSTWRLPSEHQGSVSAYYSSVNYGKEVIEMNLMNPENVNSLKNLLSEADIMISNFKKGDADKFGLNDATIKVLNPKLIHGKIVGFSEESDRVAYDLILQAETGFMSINGSPDSPPTKMPVALIDVLAAHHLKEAILLALYKREQTKTGATISVSLYDSAVSSLINQASNYLMTSEIPKRLGSLHPNIAPYGEIFSTLDGRMVCFAIGSNKHFEILCNFLGLEKHLLDTKFINNQNRVSNRIELFKILEKSVNKIKADDVLSGLQKHNVPCGEIKSIDKVFEDQGAKELIVEEKQDTTITKRVKSAIFRWK
jgi:crotonobetainyl-CoA:carnitine CoA-transferase CaiB-like acyl-CoA transferase